MSTGYFETLGIPLLRGRTIQPGDTADTPKSWPPGLHLQAVRLLRRPGLLACLGLYGVMTYNVVRRTSELGVRMALGASKGALIRLVLKESSWLLAVGIVIGIPVSLAAGSAIRAGLYGIGPSDPFTLAGATLLISICLLAGAYIPARRAAGINPIIALRYD